MDFKQLDATLGVTTRIENRSAHRVAITTAVLGEASSISPRLVRAWLRSRYVDHPSNQGDTKLIDDMRMLLNSSKRWNRVVKTARARAALPTTDEGREKLAVQIARRLVSHLLTPPNEVRSDRTPRAIASARHAMAMIFVDQLLDVGRTGFDTALVHQTKLAVRMGVSRLSAHKALRLTEEIGWLKLVRTMGGGGARYRLGRLTTKAAQERADTLYDFIEELVDVAMGRLETEDSSHPVQLLLSVRHPAWSYGRTGEGELDRTTWLVTLADSLGLDPVDTFGFSKALTNRHRKRALEAGVTDGVDVRGALTGIGTQTGAMARAQEAETARQEAAAERKRELARARIAAKAAREELEDAVKQVGGIPGMNVAPESIAVWARGMHEQLADTDHGEALRRDLRKRLVARGHEPEWAKQAVRRIIPEMERAA